MNIEVKNFIIHLLLVHLFDIQGGDKSYLILTKLMIYFSKKWESCTYKIN